MGNGTNNNKGEAMIQTAFQLGEQGAQAAAMHANRIHSNWDEKAFAAFVEVAQAAPEFTTEEVRDFAEGAVPPPPDARAWGYIAKRAVREGICERSHIGKAKAAHCHGHWITVWKSKVFKGAA